MAKYVLIDADNKAVNYIEWDGDTTKWSPPGGLKPVQCDEFQVGWVWNGEKLIDPTPAPPDVMATQGMIEL